MNDPVTQGALTVLTILMILAWVGMYLLLCAIKELGSHVQAMIDREQARNLNLGNGRGKDPQRTMWSDR